MKYLYKFLLIIHFCLLPAIIFAKCPNVEQLMDKFKQALGREIEILDIKDISFNDICEIHTKINDRPNIFYTNSQIQYFIFGQLISSDNGQNLTRKALEEYSTFTQDELKELKELVPFSVGKSKKEVYFITDPQCPYCKKGEKILKEIAEAGFIKVNFILYPLAFHKNAKEQCISIICDKKGLAGLESEYKSENQCPNGKKMIENTINLMKKKYISGTPAYVFDDGQVHTGLLKENPLRMRLGLPLIKEDSEEEDQSNTNNDKNKKENNKENDKDARQTKEDHKH